MGVGDSWGTEDELLHPRGPDGKFRESWKMASNVVSKILSTLSSFNPKTFNSDEEAAKYVYSQSRGNRFLTNRGPAIDRFLRGYSTVNADLEAGKPNADAAAIKRGMSPLPDDLVLTRDMTFEQFGLNPQAPEGIRELTGKLVSSKMFSSTNIGTPLAHEPGKITMSIATPKGTKALIPSTSKPTKEIILDTDQPFRVTKVQPDGQGGWYVYAVATGDSNNEVPVDIGRAVPDNGVEAATPETPAAPAPAAPGAPAPVPAPGAPAAPAAAPVRTGRPGRPAGPPPAPRNEGHVGTVGTGQAPAAPQGGVPEGGPEPVPPLPEAPEPGPDSRSTFREAFEQAGLKVPSVGTRRKEFNDAYLGVASGKKTPQEAVRDLDDRIAIHKATIASDKEDGTDSGPLPEDVKRLQGLSDLIKEHYNFTGRKTPKAAPEKAPEVKEVTPKAPAKKAAPKAPAAKKAAPEKKVAGPKEEPTPVTRKAAQRKESRDRLAGGAEERARQTAEEKATRETANKAREDAATKEREARIADIAKQVDSEPPESELVKARIGISDSGFKSKRVSAADTAAGLRETAGQDYAKKDRDLLLKLADFYESKGRPRKAAPAKKAAPAAGDVDNMTVPQLRAEAARLGKKIPSSITRKADIQAFLKGEKEAPLSVAETKTIATGNNGNSVIGSRRTLDSLEAKGLIEFRDAGRPSGKPAPFLTEKGRKAAGFTEKETKFPNPLGLKGSQLQADQTIRQAWMKHRNKENNWAPIASIRDELEKLGFTREEQDQALMRIGRGSITPHARIIPLANTKALTDKDRKGALKMGGEDNHALMILDMDAEGKPKDLTPGKMSTPEKAPETVAKKTEAPDIDKMTVPQLREEAKRQGKRVPTGITKKTDIQAFLRDDTENRKQSQAIREGVKATPADVKATAARSAAADTANLESKTVPELRAIAKKEGLPGSNTLPKAQLIQRIQDNRTPLEKRINTEGFNKIAEGSAPTPARKPEWGTLKTHGLKTGDEAMYYGSLRNSPKAQGRRVRIERAKYGGYDLIDVETDKKIADGANATRLWLSPLPRSAPKTEAPKPPAEKGLIYMTVPELREKARTEGIKVPPHRKTKAEIVDWLADSLTAKERGEPLPQEPGQREIRRANVAARKRLKEMQAEDRRKLAEAKAAAPKKVLPTTGAPKSHEEIAANIKAAKSREEAEKVLDDANLSIPELKQLAESMNIATRGNKTQIRKDIVYWGVGRKLDREAVSRPGEVTSRTLQDAMERRGDPALVPVESRKPLLANHWGTLGGEINYHEDGHIGTALHVMGPEAQRYEVPGENGDNLYNVLGRLATDAVRGRITQQQLIEKVKAIQAKMPDSRATRALSTAIRDMETPDLPPIELPNGVPAPITKLARSLEKIPLARKNRRGMGQGMNEADRLADLMADWQQGRMTPLRFIAELRQRLFNNRHESEEGKFDIDRVVQQALEELQDLMKVDRKKLLPPEMRK